MCLKCSIIALTSQERCRRGDASSQGEEQGPCHPLRLGPDAHPSPLHSVHPPDRAFYPSGGNGSPAEESTSCLTPDNAVYPLIFPYGTSVTPGQAGYPYNFPSDVLHGSSLCSTTAFSSNPTCVCMDTHGLISPGKLQLKELTLPTICALTDEGRSECEAQL